MGQEGVTVGERYQDTLAPCLHGKYELVAGRFASRRSEFIRQQRRDELDLLQNSHWTIQCGGHTGQYIIQQQYARYDRAPWEVPRQCWMRAWNREPKFEGP